MIITDNVISKIKLLSNGQTIEITEEECFQMKIISIILENKELFIKLNELYTNEINEDNIDEYIDILTIISQISQSSEFFNYDNIIDYIANHFYLIDKDKLKQLPKSILLSIISNSNLKLESEDSLLDFINEIFPKEEEGEEEYFNKISFYEQLEFLELSGSKFDDFAEQLEASKMTNALWRKLYRCISIYRTRSYSNVGIKRYKKMNNSIEFYSNAFEGIIDYLTKKSGGNVSLNGTVKVLSSTTNCIGHSAHHSVELHNDDVNFASANNPNSWLQFEFTGKKVHPTHYSIKSRTDCDCDHPINWLIQGSNTGHESDWTTLDTRINERSLSRQNVQQTFDINEQSGDYRYLRILQNGINSSNNHYLTLSALEFFGTLSYDQ